MAYLGLRKPYIGKYNAATGTYGTPTLSERAIQFSVTANFAEASLAADDDPNAEYDKEFIDADVTLGTDTITDRWREDMFGNTVKDGEVSSNKDDEPNYVGVGVIAPQKIKGAKTWVAVFMPLVKFAEPAEEYETKGSSITYKTPSISGKAKPDESGNWKYRKVFNSEADAIDYIEDKFGEETYTYTEVADPTGNPHELGYYVLDGTDYVLTDDTEVQSGTTYYTRS